MLEACPLCAVPLGKWTRTCRRCGLWWRDDGGWLDEPARPVAPGPGPLVRIAHPPSGVFLWALALTIPLMVLGLGAWFLFLVEGRVTWVAVLGLVYGTLGAIGTGWIVLRRLAPEHVDASPGGLRVRAERRWGERTDVFLPRERVRGVELRAWQGGSAQVWITLTGGGACCVFGACAPAQARALRDRLAGWLQG